MNKKVELFNIVQTRKTLLDFNKQISPKDLFVTLIPDAQELIFRNPFAFLIAAVLDRGMKAEIIWTIPYHLSLQLGHLDPNKIYKMSESSLADVCLRLPQKPRYIKDTPRTIKELTRIIVEKFNGDASRLWKENSSVAVKKILKGIFGVGEGIANMVVLLIERAFGVHFDDVERRLMDIKPDVHTKKVLYRLGVSKENSSPSAIKAARDLNPSFPGEIDAPLWIIGRSYCFQNDPNCSDCPLEKYCEMKIHG